MKTILAIALMLSAASVHAYCLNGHEIESGAGSVFVDGRKSGEVYIDHGVSEKCLRLQLSEEEAIYRLNEGNKGGTVVTLEPEEPETSKGELFVENLADSFGLGGLLGD